MVDKTIRDIERGVVSILRDNLSDPRNRSGQWISVMYPSTETLFPYIVLEVIGIGERGRTISMTQSEYDVDLSITVMVKENESYTIGDEELTGVELLEYLVDEVKDTLINKMSTLRTTYSSYDLFIRDVSPITLNEEYKVLQRTLTVRLLRVE